MIGWSERSFSIEMQNNQVCLHVAHVRTCAISVTSRPAAVLFMSHPSTDISRIIIRKKELKIGVHLGCEVRSSHYCLLISPALVRRNQKEGLASDFVLRGKHCTTGCLEQHRLDETRA